MYWIIKIHANLIFFLFPISLRNTLRNYLHIIYQSYGINGLNYCLIVTKDIVSKTPLNHNYYKVIRNMSNVINVRCSDCYAQWLDWSFTSLIYIYTCFFFTLRYDEFILSWFDVVMMDHKVWIPPATHSSLRWRLSKLWLSDNRTYIYIFVMIVWELQEDSYL